MSSQGTDGPVLAVDLGGTKIFAAAISHEGRMLARELTPTGASDGPDTVISRLCETIRHLMEKHNIPLSGVRAISIAAAGGIDRDKGVVTMSPNLPGWKNIPLRDMVKARFGVDTLLLNDAGAAAIGEHRWGAGRGVENMVLLTIGTGIGGGLIIRGELYTGSRGGAGEVGHMTIDVNGPKCPCGNTGCLEMLASGVAIGRDAVARIRNGEGSSLVEMVKNRLDDIDAEKVEAAARAGDRLAGQVIARAANYFGVGLVNLVNIFNPEMIVVGGGVSRMGDLYIEPARRLVKESAFPISANAVRIVPAKLGNDAGVYGAAAFAFGQKA